MRSQIQAYIPAVAIVLIVSLAHAQEPSSPAYKPPGGKKMFSPATPRGLPKDRQFWVLVTLMVDRDGKAYEAAAVDSNGPEALEESAVKNLDSAEFRPATFDNQPVDSIHRMNYSFMTGVSRSSAAAFDAAYNTISSAIARGDRPLADKLLAAIKTHGLDEDVLRNMLLYQYHQRWGTPAQQLADLRRASGIRDPNGAMPSLLASKALRPRLELEIQLNDFGGALITWDIIERSKKTQEFAPAFQATIDDINSRRTDDRSHTVAGEVDHRGSWFVYLLKRKFAIGASNGEVSHLKLRCERGFSTYKFEAGKLYETDENAGPCQLQVIGKPGTALELQQS
jgi:hypothetical protein